MVVIWMGLGLCVLISLLAYVVYKDYQRRQPEREAAIANVPLDTLQKREITTARIAGLALILLGGLKAMATEGIAGFGAVPNLLKGSAAFDGIALVYTLTISTALVVSGALVFKRRLWTYWLATTVTAMNLLQSLAVALPTFGDSRVRGGLGLMLLVMALPMFAFVFSVTALNIRGAVNLKRRVTTAS